MSSRSNYFQPKSARIMIIPMIDVMLFLLVFFIIVVLQMIPHTGINTDLPNSKTAQKLQHPKVVVSLLKDGSIQVGGSKMTLKQLTALLEQYTHPNLVNVTIAGAKQATIQQLVSVMDAAREAGVTNIGLAARRK